MKLRRFKPNVGFGNFLLVTKGADVREEIETAARMGVSGVPCFLIEGRYAVMGAQPPEALADAVRQVAAAKARGELENAG